MHFTRVAIPADFPALKQIDPWKEATPEMIATGRCIVGGRADIIEGYAITSSWFGGKPFVEIVFVAESARRYGLGSALLAAVESSHSKTRLWITTGSLNIPMQQLLHRRGYEVCGEIEKLAKDAELIYSLPPSLR